MAFLPFVILLVMGVVYSISLMDKDYKRALTTRGPLSDMETSPARPVAVGYLKFFQEYISPTDGPRCALYPTCSEYSLHAIRRHGLLLGAVMTFDRLLHEPDEKRMKKAEFIKGAYRVRDAVAENELPTAGKRRRRMSP